MPGTLSAVGAAGQPQAEPAVVCCLRSGPHTVGRHFPKVTEGVGGELGADVRQQAVEEQQQKHRLRVVPFRQQGQQLVHQSSGLDTRNMRER